MTRGARLTPMLIAATFAWLVAMLIPLTSGAFWPIVAATDVLREHAVRFSTDTASVLPIRGGEVVVQPWLSALLLKGAWELGGVTALVALQGLLAALLAVAAWLVARAHARPSVAAAAAVAFTLLIQPATLRTEQVALLIGMCLLLVLRGPRWWLAPLLVALWANVHGSFVVGVAIVVAAVLGMLREPRTAPMPLARAAWPTRAGLVAASIIATFATPLGTGIIEYVRSVDGVQSIADLTPIWRPMDPLSFRALACYAILVLVASVAARRMRSAPSRSARVRELLPLLPVLVLLAASFSSVRYVAWLALLLLPELANAAETGDPDEAPHRDGVSLGARAALAALVIGAVLLLPGTAAQDRYARIGIPPDKLLDEVEEGDVVLASAEWANFVHLRTGAKIVVDARLERYRDRDLQAYLALRDDVDGELIERSEPDWLILHHSTLADRWGRLDEDRSIDGIGLALHERAGRDAAYRIERTDG